MAEKKAVKKAVPAKKEAVKKAEPSKKPAAKKPEAKKPEAKKPAPKAAEKKPAAKKEEVNFRTYHLVKRPDGKWEVKYAGGQKAIKLFNTQKEALEYSKKDIIDINEESKEVIIKINDPFLIKMFTALKATINNDSDFSKEVKKSIIGLACSEEIK